MAVSDEEMEALVKKVEDRQARNTFIQPVQNIPDTIKLILFIGIAALFYFQSKLNLTNVQKLLIVLVIGIIWFAVGSKPVSAGLLPEQDIVAMANSQMKFKQKHGLHAGYKQINDPNAIIRIHLQGNLVRDEWGGKFLYWEHGMSIVSRDGTEELQYSIKSDPYTGMCLGVIDRPEGYTGREEPDKVPILPSKFRNEIAVDRLRKGWEYE
jgi:hypothetical protein